MDRLAQSVIGAAIEVHRRLAPGLLESGHKEALCMELDHRGIPFAGQVPIEIEFFRHSIGGSRLDRTVNESLIS